MAKKSNWYDGCKGHVFNHPVGLNVYKAKMIEIDPDLLDLGVVSASKRTGNPRLWNLERILRQSKKLTGAFDDAKIYQAFTDPAFGGRKIYEQFMNLVRGLQTTGCTNDPVMLTADGFPMEGMRRTVAYRYLKAQGDKRFDKVPCIVLDSAVTAEDVLASQNQYHNVQKQSWEAVDRAAAVANLRDEYGWKCKEIADYFGWSNNDVLAYLRSYDIHMEYQQETGDHSPKQFTKFSKVVKCKKLYQTMFDSKFAEYDETLWPRFKKWVKGGKINDCRWVAEFVSKKVNLLGTPKALSILDKEGIEAAMEFATKLNGQDRLGVIAEDLVTYIDKLTATEKAKLSGKSANSKFTLSRLQSAIARGQILLDSLDVEEAA